MSKTLIVSMGVLAILAIMTIMLMGYYNRAIRMEENINTSVSNISKEEQRRIDLFNNLVDAIESYNEFEEETYRQITEARAKGNSGEVGEAFLAINAVAEAYPQLKSQENYKQAMLEFSITENRIAGYREQYNNDVRGYNRLVRTFPASTFLSIVGYEKQQYEYLDFEVDNTEARDLFNNEQDS
jgi:LemA protein